MMKLARPEILSIVIGILAGSLFPGVSGVAHASESPVMVAASPTTSLTPQQRALGITLEDLEANPKKIGNITATLSRKDESRFRLSGMLNYSFRQDIAEQRDASIATHRVLGTTSLTILDRAVITGVDDDTAKEIVTLNLAASGQFKTVGQEIEGNVHGGPMQASDIDLSASRALEFSPLLGASSVLDLSVGSTIPTSESTQYEGIIAVPYASLGWALGFQGGRYNLTQGLSADYIINTYSHSPLTREVNAESSAGYTISASTRLGAGFRFTVGGSARLVRHLDDSTTSALANYQILSWTKGFTTITLRHTNGARAEDRQANLWFVDEYRRILSLGLSVRF